MSAINPPVAVPDNNGLKISLIIFSVLGMAVWGTSIGFLFGYQYGNLFLRMLIGMAITIPTNAGMIYVSSRLLFLVMDRSFPSVVSLQDLHQCVARMVALTVVGFSTWVSSVVWMSYNPDYVSIILYHACNYGFVLSAVIAGLAGGLLQVTNSQSRALPVTVGPKYVAPQPGQVPHQHQQSHYNQAYVHHYPQQQRM